MNFTIQNLKSKHTSLKKYTNWAKLIHFSLVWREQEEKKLEISHLGNHWAIEKFINNLNIHFQGILNDIYQDGVVWHDIACYHTKPYVCEDSDQLLDFVRASLKAKGSDMVIPEPPEELEVDP